MDVTGEKRDAEGRTPPWSAVGLFSVSVSTYVFRHQMALLQRNAQQYTFCVLDMNFLFATLVIAHNANEFTETVRGVNNEISFFDFAQRSLGSLAAQADAPKNKPIAPVNFISPIPIASFPNISPPIKVITPKIAAPTIIPNM